MVVDIFCQKHPTENLYFGQVGRETLEVLLPRTDFGKLNGNNITVNVREIGSSDTSYSPVELEFLNGFEDHSHGILSIDSDNVECSVVRSSEIGNQSDGGDMYNVTFQSFKKRVSVRIDKELADLVTEFPTDDAHDVATWEKAFMLVRNLKEQFRR